MNRKNALIFLAIFAGVTYQIYSFNIGVEYKLSELKLQNIIALTETEAPRLYETKNTEEIEIWDDATQTYKKLVTISCEGKGILQCP